MKTLLLTATVLFGTVAASQAGIDLHIGLPWPPLPQVIVTAPAPVVVAPARSGVVCGPIPVSVAPRSVVLVRSTAYGYPYPRGRVRHGRIYSRGYYCR